jgi:hypothetical protein
MPEPPATYQGNADANEITVRPTSAQSSGVIFSDPLSGRWCIPGRDLAANQIGAARDNGQFKCLKQTPTDVLTLGMSLDFAGNGYVVGSAPLEVAEASASGDRYVFAELNPATSGGVVTGSGANTYKLARTAADPLMDAHVTGDLLTADIRQDPNYASAVLAVGDSIFVAVDGVTEYAYDVLFGIEGVFAQQKYVHAGGGGGAGDFAMEEFSLSAAQASVSLAGTPVDDESIFVFHEGLGKSLARGYGWTYNPQGRVLTLQQLVVNETQAGDVLEVKYLPL